MTPRRKGPRSFDAVLFLFRAAKVCAVALAAVSGSLWLAWAVQSTFTQGDWTSGVPADSGACTTAGGAWNAGTSECFATSPNYKGYSKKGSNATGDDGLGVDTSDPTGKIKLQSIGYTATDDGTLTTTGTPPTTATGGTFAAGTSTATSTIVSGTDALAKVTLRGAWVWACGDTVSIDTNTYNTVLIGTQCWMKENLRTTKYQNNAAITRGPTGATWNGSDNGYYAYPPNTSNSAEETLANITSNNLGFLYQWSAVVNANGICPSGWHVPTDADFTTLTNAAGTKSALITAGWFNNVFPGYRQASGSSYARGEVAYFWSSSVSGSDAWGRRLSIYDATLNRYALTQAWGLSVRCLQD